MTNVGRILTEAEMRRLKAIRFFSMGYQLIPADSFLAILAKADVGTVVDVRENAWSRKPGFSASQLKVALASEGIQYIHAGFAGNPKELRRTVSEHAECLRRYAEYLSTNEWILQDLVRLILDLDEASRICFICYERHPEDCHRSILVNQLTEEVGGGLEVRHLCSEGAPRFVKE